MAKSIVCSLYIFIVSFVSINAQVLSPESPFVHYTSEDGLSQLVVRTIVQDKYGFIWVGTEDGLNKFDGYEFKVYRNVRNDKKSIPDNFIYSITPARDGGLWIGTNNGGLAKYNSSTDDFTTFQFDPNDEASISANRVESIYEDNNGIVWLGIGTANGGLNRLNPKTGEVTRYLTDEEFTNQLTSTSVISIADDQKGNLWVRTYTDFLLFNKETEAFTILDVPPFQVGDISDKSVFIDSDGVLWAANGNSLLKMNTSTKEYELVYFSDYPTDNVALIDIEEFNDNYLWLNDFTQGIFLFNKSDYSVIRFSHDEKRGSSILSGMAIALLQDQTGSVWTGIHSKGISKLNINRKKFTHFRPNSANPETLNGSVIKGILVDQFNNIWVSADSRVEKLNLIFDEAGTYVRDTSSKYSQLTSSQPNCFFEDKLGNIWIGTWGDGVYILEGGNIDYPTHLSADGFEGDILDNIVQAIYEDRFGNIWIGSETGITLYNPGSGQYRHFTHDPANENTLAPYGVQANCIVEDAYGNIWVGTWGGLTRIIPKDISVNTFDVEYDFIRYRNNPDDLNSLSDNRIISLYYDKAVNPDEIYAGTYGTGLNKITFSNDNTKENTITTYTRNEGLPNDVVYSILSDDYGHLWISTNDGLANFNPKNNNFEVYDVNDGLQANQFFWGARAKGNNGELLFGGINGFNMFKPEEIESDKTKPNVVFTDFKVLNESVAVGQKINKHVILKQGINQTEKIVLTHRENVFTIEFAGLHYAFPANNKYKYMMDGFDEDWIQVDGRKRFASYTNLDPGKYTFMVDASNYDGVWSEDIRIIEIRIKPPFWKRWWFRIMLLLIAAFIAYEFYKNRRDRIKRDKRILEEKIQEGQKVIEEKVKEVEKQQDEIKKRDLEEEEMRFLNKGLAKFSEILSAGNDNLHELSQQIISELVSYVGAVMGVIYVFQENSEEGILEQYAAYAADSDTLDRKHVRVGEGYIGTCFLEGKTIKVDDIPKGYSKLTSGLGEVLPSNICLIPIMQRGDKQGVIELATLKPLEEYKIQFVEKIAENIRSVISIRKASEKLNDLLEQSNQQTEELRSQEEEMRQNMEEMHATQEEMSRREEEWVQEKSKLVAQCKRLKEENKLLKKSLDESDDEH
jgi:ligand-binding sensor domain-containing protein